MKSTLESRQLNRVAWRNWFLLAGVSVLTTLGLGSAILPLVEGQIAHVWPWRDTEIILLLGLSVITLFFAIYLTLQQRQLESLRQQLHGLQQEELRRARHQAQVVELMNTELKHEIEQRKSAQENLRILNESLEARIAERTRAAEAKASELQEMSHALEDRNKRLVELYRTAHQFVDNVSHEFRTPLTVIREYADVLQDGGLGEVNDEQSEYLNIIVQRAEDLSVMVNDILDISKIESDILRMVRKFCSIDDVFARVRGMLERKALANHVTLEMHNNSDLPLVFCDMEKIGRVLVNLVVNALKFTDPGGRVTVQAQFDEVESVVEVQVADTGCGIAPENLEIIFKRFKQVHQGSRNSSKGFGLGLSIVRELVHLNLGEVRVASELGRGSVFTFTLPVEDPKVLMRQYLRTMRHFRAGANHVSLLTLETPPTSSGDVLHEINEVLVEQMRRGDLLLRSGNNEWLLIAVITESSVGRLIARLKEAYAAARYGRERLPLPSLRIEARGTIDVTRDESGIYELFAALYRRGMARTSGTSG